jgi:ubiquinone/menaquinone biosynthesis C-methylase UbiE
MKIQLNKILNLQLFLLLSFMLSNCLALAAETNVRPGINDYYYDANFKQWLTTFESSGREVFDKKESIIKALQIKPKMRIADIGAGTGLYTIPFAHLVGVKGLVYAVDISDNFVKNIEIRAKEHSLNNVIGHINNQKEIGLAKNSIDLAFICNTYHHFEYPLTTLKSVYQSLVLGGRLVIIDFKRDPKVSSSWVMGHVRAHKEKVIKEVESAGFKLIDDNDMLKQNYFLSFSK